MREQIDRSAAQIADLEQLAAHLGPNGGVRVVNHWATWCIPCIEEFGDLKDLHAGLPAGVSASKVLGAAEVDMGVVAPEEVSSSELAKLRYVATELGVS